MWAPVALPYWFSIHLQSYEKRFTYPNECVINLNYAAKSYTIYLGGGTDGRWQFSREHVNVLRLTVLQFSGGIRYQISVF